MAEYKPFMLAEKVWTGTEYAYPNAEKVLAELNRLAAENAALRRLAFHTGPGEFSPEGWTWQQQAACDLARALEAEAALSMATLAHDLAAVLDFDPSIEVYIYPNGDGNYGIRLLAPDEKMGREHGCVFRVLGCDLTKLVAECRAWCDRNKGQGK